MHWLIVGKPEFLPASPTPGEGTWDILVMMSFTRPLMQGCLRWPNKMETCQANIEVFACSLHSFFFFFHESKAELQSLAIPLSPTTLSLTDSHSVNSIQKSSSWSLYHSEKLGQKGHGGLQRLEDLPPMQIIHSFIWALPLHILQHLHSCYFYQN